MQMQRQSLDGFCIRKVRAVHLAPIANKDTLHQIDRGLISVHDPADLIHMGQDCGQGFRLRSLCNPVPVIEKAQKNLDAGRVPEM